MKGEFIETDDPRWRQALDVMRHDLYHLPEYVKLSALYEGGAPLAFLAEENGSVFLIPLLVRKLPAELEIDGDWYDTSTPYGFPSPISTEPVSKDKLARFIEAFHAAAIERGIIAAFLRLHPLLSMPLDEFNKSGILVEHGKVVYADLTQKNEELWDQVSRDHKAGIRKLIKTGFTARFDDWGLFDKFVNIYIMTMKRVAASEFYLFTDEYFARLRETLGNYLHLCTVHAPDGDIAAAGLITVVNGIAQAHLAGTSNQYLKKAPSKLKYDAVRRWAKNAGCSHMLYGGGVGGNEDGLFKFKAGFSRSQAPFYTCRFVFNRDRYSTACARWESRHRTVASLDTEFFPAYRQPHITTNAISS